MEKILDFYGFGVPQAWIDQARLQQQIVNMHMDMLERTFSTRPKEPVVFDPEEIHR